MINVTTCTYNNFLKHASSNVRVAFTDKNDTPQVVQKNNYYPWLHSLLSKYGTQAFGLRMAEKYDEPYLYGRNRYLYNSKELVPDVNLNWYDYGARFYDPQLGRWHSVDPMAELSRRWSSYTYAYNNPERFIDPDGMYIIYDFNGNPHVISDIDVRDGNLDEDNQNENNSPIDPGDDPPKGVEIKIPAKDDNKTGNLNSSKPNEQANSGGDGDDRPFIKSPYYPYCESESSLKNLYYNWEYAWNHIDQYFEGDCNKGEAPKPVQIFVGSVFPPTSAVTNANTVVTGTNTFTGDNVSTLSRTVASPVSIILIFAPVPWPTGIIWDISWDSYDTYPK